MKNIPMQHLIKYIIEIMKKERFSVLIGLLACFYCFYPRANGTEAIIHFCSFTFYILIVFFWWWYTIARFARYGLSKDKKWYKRVISFSIGMTFIIISVYFISCMLYASWTIANISKM